MKVCTIGCATDLFQIDCESNEVTCTIAVGFYATCAVLILAFLCFKNKTSIQSTGKQIVNSIKANTYGL